MNEIEIMGICWMLEVGALEPGNWKPGAGIKNCKKLFTNGGPVRDSKSSEEE